jgi:hypothetical protein
LDNHLLALVLLIKPEHQGYNKNMKQLLCGIGAVVSSIVCLFGWLTFGIGYNRDTFLGHTLSYSGSLGLMIGGLIVGVVTLLLALTLSKAYFQGSAIKDNHGEF